MKWCHLGWLGKFGALSHQHTKQCHSKCHRHESQEIRRVNLPSSWLQTTNTLFCLYQEGLGRFLHHRFTTTLLCPLNELYKFSWYGNLIYFSWIMVLPWSDPGISSWRGIDSDLDSVGHDRVILAALAGREVTAMHFAHREIKPVQVWSEGSNQVASFSYNN